MDLHHQSIFGASHRFSEGPSEVSSERALARTDPYTAAAEMGCCDDSKNKHATKHFHATQHPIITSLEPGEDWSWCYVDEVAMELK